MPLLLQRRNSDYVMFNRYTFLRPFTETNISRRIWAVRTNQPWHIVSKEIHKHFRVFVYRYCYYFLDKTWNRDICRPKADNLIQVTHMAVNKRTTKTTYFISETASPLKKLWTHHRDESTHMVPNRNTVQHVSTYPAPRIIAAEYVLRWIATNVHR
jgi:hypothetical protein